jgi:hypothetical protein
MCTGVMFPGIKRSWLEADHSLSSGVEDKNGGAIAPVPHRTSWYGD